MFRRKYFKNHDIGPPDHNAHPCLPVSVDVDVVDEELDLLVVQLLAQVQHDVAQLAAVDEAVAVLRTILQNSISAENFSDKFSFNVRECSQCVGRKILKKIPKAHAYA
jgi:hypothetical protein